ATFFHAVPFQCSISVWFAVPLKYHPVAQALDEEVAATPYMSLSASPWFGLDWSFYAVPFQRSMRVRSVPKLLAFPTAQALDEEMTVTPWRTFSWPPPVAAFGDATAFQPWQVAD